MFFIPVFVAVFWFGSSAIAISNRLILTYTLEQIRIRGSPRLEAS